MMKPTSLDEKKREKKERERKKGNVTCPTLDICV